MKAIFAMLCTLGAVVALIWGICDLSGIVIAKFFASAMLLVVSVAVGAK